MESVDEGQARLALRVLVDYLKSEAEKRGSLEGAMQYEPMLSYLIGLKM